MARPYYAEAKDGFFHVTSRGNARRTIFEDDRDCLSFIAELEDTVTRHRWRCLSYCLMGNHFHLLLQTPDANLAAGMRDLKSQHARRFNGRRGRDGSLFKPRFGRQLVQDDAYLLAAAIYIAQNPVRSGKAEHPADWRWSSFRDTVSGAATFVDAGPILRLLDSDAVMARRQYWELAHAVNGLPAFDPSPPIVGDRAFVRVHAPEERPGRHVVKRVWEQARPSLKELALAYGGHEFLEQASVVHRYTLLQIADHLGCDERTVRRRLARVSGAGTRRSTG